MKIVVIGTTGSGKSTVASSLAKKFNYPHIELDKLYWKPNWSCATDEEFFQKIEDSIKSENWIIDGNYTKTQFITWSQADTIVWVDLPFTLTVYQCLTRSISRSISAKELWPGTGNTESFSKLFSSDSILVWLLKTYKKNRKNYEEQMGHKDNAHIKFYRLKSRKETTDFINSFTDTL